MSELEHLINKFLSKDATAQVYYKLNQDKFNKVVNRLGIYEKPDILSIYDNVILGIEHFEFDSYNRSNKKGSDYKVKDYRVEKRFDEEIKDKLQSNDSVIVHDKITSTATINNYYKNFEDIFKEHYQKIQSYIDHIKQDFDCKNKEIHICFFAEDVTPLGNYFLDKSNDRKITPLLPIFSDKIRQLLEDSPLVEYLVIGSFCMTDNRLFIIENKNEAFKRFAKDYKEVIDDDFFSFEPQTTGFAFKVQKDEIIRKNNK